MPQSGLKSCFRVQNTLKSKNFEGKKPRLGNFFWPPQSQNPTSLPGPGCYNGVCMFYILHILSEKVDVEELLLGIEMFYFGPLASSNFAEEKNLSFEEN